MHFIKNIILFKIVCQPTVTYILEPCSYKIDKFILKKVLNQIRVMSLHTSYVTFYIGLILD